MKNAFITGITIGVLSGLWLFAMHFMGYDLSADKVSPYEYFSILIPLAGLYFGLRSYRNNDLGGNMGFFESLIQGFKILIAGGIVAGFMGILYVSYIESGDNILSFSGRLFAALLVGVLGALGISLLLTTKSNKVD